MPLAKAVPSPGAAALTIVLEAKMASEPYFLNASRTMPSASVMMVLKNSLNKASSLLTSHGLNSTKLIPSFFPWLTKRFLIKFIIEDFPSPHFP